MFVYSHIHAEVYVKQQNKKSPLTRTKVMFSIQMKTFTLFK